MLCRTSPLIHHLPVFGRVAPRVAPKAAVARAGKMEKSPSDSFPDLKPTLQTWYVNCIYSSVLTARYVFILERA